MKTPRLRTAIPFALSLIAAFGPIDGALAAQRDISLLKAYVGDWRGRGTLTSADGEETIVCKLGVTDTAATQVTLRGACSMAGGKLTLAGTMAYMPQKNRYEAVVSSNTRFSGQAIGHRSGGGIVFALRNPDPATGDNVDLVVDMALRKDVIDVKFTAKEQSSGRSTTVRIPLSK